MENGKPGKPGTIAEAIAATIANTGSVPMSGYNRHHGYKFATVEDVLSAVRGPMADAGLSYYPVDYEIVSETKVGAMTRREYRFLFHLVHVDGQRQAIAVCGGGLDGQDKHYPKALTMAIKNFAISLFLLPRGGLDPDSTEGNYPPEAKKKAAPKRRAATKRKPKKAAPPPEPAWCAYTDGRFVALSKSMGHDSEEELADLISLKGWPHPRSWTQERLLNFLGAMDRGELQL